MEKETFTIPNITCHHCTMTIESELKELEGVSLVESDVKARQVTVHWQAPADRDKITALLEEINYHAV